MANKVAIVTDSTAYIPPHLSEGYEIHITPSIVIWEGKEYRDGVTIQPAEFYERLKDAKEMPTTSQPSPGDVLAVYQKLHDQGYDILAYMISDKLSGTLDSAKRAKDMLPDANIEVVDSFQASMAAGWPILEAARAAKEGANLAECTAIAKAARSHAGVILLVETLEFLHRGGRIGGAARFIGTALNFKPLLEVQDGRIESLERARTTKKAIARLVELVAERIDGKTPVHLAVLNANAPEQAEKVMALAKNIINPATCLISELSPAVGTHTGPGTLGIAYMAGYKR
jgi:DegV family protein with EDD domain